eukprot:TRINITY_DN12355_c0_g1_i2.p1 TRINITY_DN12355_c0_g1~~TRINITY_DN12355_c0_g1_i2.p1  ORF type:complete len:499 (-),score=109.62 TRINITY_DN12355_c0_g1_i2:25-1461(-)
MALTSSEATMPSESARSSSLDPATWFADEASVPSMEQILNFSCEIVAFVKKYAWLTEGNVVNYIIEDQWSRVPKEWNETLLSLSVDEAALLPSNPPVKGEWPASLKQFISDSKRLSLSRKPIASISQKQQEVLNAAMKIGMKSKKQHEVEILGRLVNELVPASSSSSPNESNTTVIEVGSGHGYLSTALSSRFSLSVIGIDGCESYTVSAKQRAESVTKKRKKQSTETPQRLEEEQPTIQPKFLASFIPPDTTPDKFQELLQLPATEAPSSKTSMVLVGLHTCGDLAPTMLRLFVNCDVITTLISVGCCYNRLTEKEECPDAPLLGFPMSSSIQETQVSLGVIARMTSCQAINRWQQASEQHSQNEEMFKKHSYRAVLEVLLKQQFQVRGREMGGIGRMRKSKCLNFATYAKAGVRSLGIQEERIQADEVFSSDDRLEAFYAAHQDAVKTIPAFWSLRACLAAPIESLILLDLSLIHI